MHLRPYLMEKNSFLDEKFWRINYISIPTVAIHFSEFRKFVKRSELPCQNEEESFGYLVIKSEFLHFIAYDPNI